MKGTLDSVLFLLAPWWSAEARRLHRLVDAGQPTARATVRWSLFGIVQGEDVFTVERGEDDAA